MSDMHRTTIDLLHADIASLRQKNDKLIKHNAEMQNEIRIFKKLFRAMRTIIESGESR